MNKNTANYITVFRIVLVPFFIWALQHNDPWTDLVAMILFVVACLSDAVDGYIARKYHLVSNFGKIMDPLADKVLVLSAVVVLVGLGEVKSWVAVVILARELAVTSLRSVAAAEGKVIAADFSGKVKTFVQMVALFFLMTPWGRQGTFHEVLVWGMVLVTLWSGVDYFVKNRRIILPKSH